MLIANQLFRLCTIDDMDVCLDDRPHVTIKVGTLCVEYMDASSNFNSQIKELKGIILILR